MSIFDAIGSIGSLVGGFFDRKANKENLESQQAMQREFAQSGIQWKVNDAKAAGIHPLAALGAQTASYSPQSIGDSGSFSDMGQNLGRALKAAASSDDRKAQELEDLALTRARLDNDLVRSQIEASKVATSSRRGAALGPPMPTPPVAKTAWTGAPVTADKIETKDDTYPAVKNLRVGGVPLQTAPWMSDAQDMEDRYGESISDWVGGPLNLIADSVYSAYKGFRKIPSKYSVRFGGTGGSKWLGRR